MCGIAGFISARVSPDARRSAVERMNAAMLHRGPDDHGVITDGPATLGMRRLAIFDPAHGHQPMTTPDGRHHIVFNGAIYNFRELRAELTSVGHTFHTECDTEVLLAAFAYWGEKCLSRLRGMFAFAVWDCREQTLFLARDPLGIKPLYYSQHADGSFLFASELRALIASGHCSDAISPESVNACLAYLAPHAPATIYRDALSLRPGECATLKNSQLQIRPYWTFRDAAHPTSSSVFATLTSPLSFPPPASTRAEFISQLRAQLDDSIRAHTLADVPVGAFLSGGLDSGIIAGLMARQHAAKLKTFSIGFAETAYSEANEAAETAAYLGTEHTAIVLSGEQVAADLPKILASFDQPTGDAVNTWYASQLARAGGVTIALSGLGGDELFGGYRWFRSTPKIASWLPLWRTLPSALQRPILAQLRRGRTRRQKLADFLEHASDLHSLAALQRRNFSEVQRTALLSPDFANTFPFSPHPELAHLRDELPLSSSTGSNSNSGIDPFSIISAWELRTYMADVLLRDSDVMSMSHSLELRVPFVDRPLLEWLWRQPARFKDDRSASPKAILAEAARDVLPPDLLTRRKRGFTLPFPLWMRGSLRPFLDETFSESSVARSGFFNTRAVCARWQTFLSRDVSRDWSRLWSLAILITFVNRRTPAAR